MPMDWSDRPGVEPHEPVPMLFRLPFAHYLCLVCEWPLDYYRAGKSGEMTWRHLSTSGYPPEAVRKSALWRRVKFDE